MAKSFLGTVVSDKTDKTISVKVVTHKTHPLYKKQYIESRKFKAHDEKNESRVGDKVSIEETRPISRDKYFVLKKIIDRPVLTEDNKVQTEEVIEKIEKKTGTKLTNKKADAAEGEEA